MLDLVGHSSSRTTSPRRRSVDYVFNRHRGASLRSCRPFPSNGGVVSDRPILPKLDNQQIWTGPGLCLLVVVIGSNYSDFLRLLFAMGRNVLLAGNATTVPADESLSCLSAAAVLSADDFSLDSGAD